MVDEVHVLAIAGGAGTRFWPLSRKARPKHLLPWYDGSTLLAATFSRVSGLVPVQRHWMVVGAEHGEACRRAVPAIDQEHVVVEPVGRNTAAAIGLGIIHIAHTSKAGRDAIVIVLPADQTVADAQAFTNALKRATQRCHDGSIVTLGITPTYPETGYGYIERGDPIDNGNTNNNAHQDFWVKRFCEKPDAITAASYIKTGTFDWNAGIFTMRAGTYLDALAQHMPEHFSGLERVAKSIGTKEYDALLREVYASLASVSVDYGIMEHAKKTIVIPVSCGWSDVGGFRAMADIARATLPRDAFGNVTRGEAIFVHADNCFVESCDDHLVAVVGLDDIAVVHTHDATLVVPLDRAQEVRDVVDRVRSQGWESLL